MDDRVARIVRLAQEAEAGKLDKLECPECRELTVSVWFTHPSEPEYRTWFQCVACNFETRAHLAARPQLFSEERRRADLETRDRQIVEGVLFKRPSN